MSALTKGFQILKATSAASDGLSFSEIVETTRLAKATAHRLLRELVDLAALNYDDATRRYRCGLLLAGLGASVMENYDVRRVVRPFLESLHEGTNSVATLGIRDGEHGIYIDKIEPAGFVIRLHSEVGKSFPLHCTAMGKALLAHSDAETITRLARRKLPSFTANTITDGRRLKEELATVLDRGFAIDREEITRGLICVAAPIRGIDGEVSSAMSCTISSFDASPEKLEQISKHVVRCAIAASTF